MAKFLGKEIINPQDTEEFKDYGKSDWALYFIERFGQIEGGHHKAYVLDQVARVLKGCEVEVSIARWDSGEWEYRVCLKEEETQEYLDWVEEMKCPDENGQYEYDYDKGIAP